MHAVRDDTITPRSRQMKKPSLQALKPLVSPITTIVAPGGNGTVNRNGTGNGSSTSGSGPIMEWLSRKLGHGRRSTITATSAAAAASRMATPDSGKASKEKSFSPQTSSLGIPTSSSKNRKQQAMMTAIEARRRSSHHRDRASSIKSTSIRSSQPRPPPFSPQRTTLFAKYPRAATFMTRSDPSPGSSFISSPSRSRRSSTEHSLAESYLDVDDPDSRSYVPSVMADEDASMRPFPPCSPDQRSTTDAASIPRSTSSTDGIRLRHPRPSILSYSSTPPLQPPPSLASRTRRNSQSTTTTTHSSFGAQSRTWTNDRGARSIDTRPTILSSIDLPRVAHIAQVPPPQQGLAPAAPIGDYWPRRGSTVGIHRTGTRDSAVSVSANPAVPSPLWTSVTAAGSGNEPQPRSTLDRALGEGDRLSPPATGSGYPCHVPRHSHPHPRDNPRPLSPPEENASLVTLASSEFARPGMAGRAGSRDRSLAGGGSVLVWSPMSSPSNLSRRQELPTPEMGSATGYTLTSNLHDDEDEDEDEDDDDRYSHDQTPIMSVDAFTDRGDTYSSPRERRPRNSVDRASSYYFNPGLGLGPGSLGAHAPNTSLRSNEDRQGTDDRASVTAMRRKGSWESGESSFSWVGAGGGAGHRGSASVASYHARYSPSLSHAVWVPPAETGSLAPSLARLSMLDARAGGGADSLNRVEEDG